MMKRNHKKGKSLLLLAFLSFSMLCSGSSVKAAETVPYDTYTYDHYEDQKYTPAAYVPDGMITGTDWEIGSLAAPQDMNIADDGTIYIADTGNNRIVVLGSDYEVQKVITSYEYDGKECTFNKPSGVYYSLSGHLYVADTGNFRVVALDDNGATVKIIENPVSEVLEEGFVFSPLKVAVDYADRVYVIAQNMFQGIMAFDAEGNFRGFSGKIEVKITTAEKIWRKFTTKEQRSRQELFIPTEFTGMEIDEDGFIYASSIDAEGKQSVRRLNPRGEDVIEKGADDKVSGDMDWRLLGNYSGASRIVDVIIRDKGIYSMLDYTRGRIFTYDDEGNLLYIFGGIGTQEGTFNAPVAIDVLGDDILVLDSSRNAVMLFSPTRYGELINEAVGLRFDGDEKKAVECWEEVIKLDSNFELAYSGIGKSLSAAGEYKEAMKYFELAKDQQYYSIAFKRYRNEILKENLQWILTGVIVLIAAVSGYKYLKARKERRQS